LQPFIGFYTDKKPKPYSLAIGMVFTISGLFIIDSNSVWMILVAVSLVGIGSSIFHPEASRVAFRFWRERGLAQSIFQLGGNTGSARTVAGCYNCGTLWSIEYHLVCARGYFRMFVLTKIAVWYQNHLNLRASKKQSMRKKQFHFRKEK
jgi:FSR family fosmidomycin resistance protein-like MFS transporter